MTRFRLLLFLWCATLVLGAVTPIRVGLSGWSTLNPLLLSRDTDVEVTDLLFDRLVTVDEHGRFLPEMLQSWEVRDGGREVILRLRPGLTWHDGSPIEAADLVFTWKMLRLPQVRAINDTVPGVRSLDDLQAEGPLTVRIRLSQPRGTLMSDLYNFIPVPRKYYAVGAHPASQPINFAPVGSGPYRVVGQADRKHVTLERWAGYHGPHPGSWPAFELVNTDPIKDVRPPLLDGQLHLCPVGPLTHYLVRHGAILQGRLKAYASPQAAFNAFFLNCDPHRSLLGDVRLRQALAEMVPWEELSRGRQLFGNRLATSFWSPESWAYDPTPRPLPKLSRAVALLDDAGWRLGPDGLRHDEQGRALTLIAYEESDAGKRSVTHLLVARAATVGVRIEIRPVSFDDLAVKAANHEGDIWAYGWTTGLDPNDDSPLFTHEGLLSKANVSAYQNPEIDKLFDEGQHTLDPGARKRIYRRIADLIWRDRPVIPLTYNLNRYVASPALQGVAFNTLGQPYAFWPGMRGWTLAE
ncbi:MAG TPA: ABC transporter substrate-binding protein [Holophagaceae bacterium]